MACNNYNIEGAPSIDVEWLECDGTTNSDTVTTAILICAQTGSVTQTGGAGNITQLSSCFVPTPTPTQTPTTTPSYVEYTITSFGYNTTGEACASLNTGVSVYAEAGNTVPIVTMIFYDNTGLTIPYSGGSLSQYYLLERLGTKWAAQVNTVGELTDYANCSVTPTPTPSPTPDLYVYYNANVFDCTDCGPNVVPTSIVKFLAPFTPNNTLYYITNPLNGKFYRTTTQTTSQTATLLETTSYSGCATACGFTPTPTPTPGSTPASTPASTPTQTQTQTPSSTPTLGSWSMTNTSGDVDISNMTFNTTVTVTSGAFPSTPATTILGNSELGTNTLTLNTVTTNLPYQFITVIDSNGASQQQALSPIPFNSNVNFPNVFIDVNTPIQILVQEILPITPTQTQTSTPTSTPTPTTTSTVVTTIAMSYIADGYGGVSYNMNVTSGTTLTNMYFSGNSVGFYLTGCTGSSFGTTYNFSVNAGDPSGSQGQFFGAVLSAQSNTLTISDGVNTVPITTNSQVVNLGGDDYLITGALNCFSFPAL